MSYSAYFDTPGNYDNNISYTELGSSPYLLKELMAHLDRDKHILSEVYLAFYLFNNSLLNDKLLELASIGVAVHIITIPINGYEKDKKSIKSSQNNKTICYASKHDLANKIFNEYAGNERAGVSLHFFPHQYIRSANHSSFSKGELPYSLHTKSILCKYKDGGGWIGITSSNFAVRDLIKEEYLVIIENNDDYLKSSDKFFKELLQVSILNSEFENDNDYRTYEVPLIPHPKWTAGINFTSPFYKNSNFYAEKYLIDFVAQAKYNIQIAAQHFFPVAYYLDANFHTDLEKSKYNKRVLLKIILEKARAGVKIQIISQTIASGDRNIDKKHHEVKNCKAGLEFYAKTRHIPNIQYCVNDNVHSKYIIVDDAVFLSTFNYTPSQFIYYDDVLIYDGAELKYKGIFSECGAYCIIEDGVVVKQFKENFQSILAKSSLIFDNIP